MSVGDLIGAGVGLLAGDQQADAAEDAARDQSQAAREANDYLRQNMDQTRQGLSPYMDQGLWAVGRERQFLDGDYSHALSSPDYTARFNEGLRGLDRSAASRGSLNSGGHSADLLNYGGGMATQGLNQYWSRLTGISNRGADTTMGLGQLGASTANNMGQNAMWGSNARASGYQNRADAFSGTAYNLGNIANQAGQSRGWWT